MIAEIISIGTELLLGQIVNTNAAFVARELAALGINTYHQSVVGDNAAKIKETIEIAEGRSELLIFIGGLGPTEDDVTKQTVSEHLHEPLILDPGSLEHIRRWFQTAGRTMTENNQKQALYFQKGRFFKNANGLALGSFIAKNGKSYLFLPGPPKELEKMFADEVKPFLETVLQGERQYIISKVFRFYGIGESALASRLKTIIEKQTNPTIAPYAGNFEVAVRVTANGKNKAKCESLIEEAEKDILAEIGEYFYGEGEDNSLEKTVKEMLQERGLKISAAESLTGGMFQSQLVSVPECGTIFPGGIVSYEERIKQDVLGVPASILEKAGMVSEECAVSMAVNCRRMFQTDMAISFTGAAGPEELEGNPPGTVWIGISQEGQSPFARQYRFLRDREGNREQTVLQGMDLIRRTLIEQKKN